MSKSVYSEIGELFQFVPRKKGWRAPEYAEYGVRQYRGKRQYVAGYSHSRIGAHHFSGIVYDRILGWGPTQEAAIAMMRKRLQAKP